ncbi:peptide methionine sulfoxide reductase [Flavobacteriales bacterium 34_180_T64]|nr:peptide methionine sulfoxide reductase [Flavobacteriales bacterium 34_180_T64]
MKTKSIGLGGGCHWCTEAVFQSLKGVIKVEQGFIASGENNIYSEGVIVHFDIETISLEALIEIHLHTHKSTSNHSMRDKYRSAVYAFSEAQMQEAKRIINVIQDAFKNEIITKVLPFESFKPSRESIQNYYSKNPEKPFCETFINPKLRQLLNQFSNHVELETLKHLIK